jgi:hypothetical protein
MEISYNSVIELVIAVADSGSDLDATNCDNDSRSKVSCKSSKSGNLICLISIHWNWYEEKMLFLSNSDDMLLIGK